MKTQWLETLAAIRRHGSFSQVARDQGVSPMAISKQMNALEESLGEAVLERSTRSLTLTEFGQSLLTHSHGLLEEKRALLDWCATRHQEPSGTLRVMANEGEMIRELVVPHLAEFLAMYPKIQVELSVHPEPFVIESDTADVFWGVSDYLGRRSPGLKQRRLCELDYGIYAAPDYLAKFGEPTSPSELEHHQIIGYTHNHPSNLLVINHGDGHSGDTVPTLQLPTSVKSTTGLLSLAEQGLGLINLAAIVDDVKKSISDGRLVPVLKPYWVTLPLYVYFHQVKAPQPKVKAFVDFFWERAQSVLDG